MNKPPGKILIIKPSALGDVVQALPVLTGLKRQWPDAQIDWVISDSLKELLDGHPCLHELILYPRRRWTLWHWPEIQRWAQRLKKKKYDLVIDLQGLLRSGLMAWASASPRRLGLQSAREGSRFAYTELIQDTAQSAAERYLTCLEHLQISPDRFDFQLQPRAPLPNSLKGFESYFVLHPYSRWRTKLWPFRCYQDLIQLMPDQNFVMLGQGAWFPLEKSTRVVDLRGRLGLGELVSVLAQGAAVLSTDSGPAHIAAALGRPTLVLFGATDWRKTKPVGPNVQILTKELFCSPCLKRNCWRDLPMECMTLISPSQVAHHLRDLSLNLNMATNR